MAHQIQYKPSSVILSSSIPDIPISVDGAFVDVRLTAGTEKILLSERYYAYSAAVSVVDLASLVEQEMRASGSAYGEFTLSVFTGQPTVSADSHTYRILYCDRYVPQADVEAFLAENFLTTLALRRIAPAHPITLYGYFREGESMACTLAYRVADTDGTQFAAEIAVNADATASADGVAPLKFSLAVPIADAALKLDLPIGDVTLQTVTIFCGLRSATFFVDPALAEASLFRFRNCFNAWDSAVLQSVTTAKTVVHRSTATINRAAQFYDQSVEKTYQVESGSLTSDEAEWIDQLLTSHEVMLSSDPILITESTCEVAQNDSEPSSVKFTYRHLDNRPAIDLPTSPANFSKEFNPTFS